MGTTHNPDLGVVGSLLNALQKGEREGIRRLLDAGFSLDVSPDEAGTIAGHKGTNDAFFAFLETVSGAENFEIDPASVQTREATAEEKADSGAKAVAEMVVHILDGKSHATIYFWVLGGKITYAHVRIGSPELAHRAFG
jgi:hypothetical protein